MPGRMVADDCSNSPKANSAIFTGSQELPDVKPKQQAARITAIYLVIGCFWILLSDQAMSLLVHDQTALMTVSMIKGWLYVLFTAILIFVLVYNRLQRVQAAIIDRAEAEANLRENQRFLSVSQQVAKIGSYVIDLEAKTWRGSPVVDEIFGIDENYPHTLEGWAAIIHPDSKPGLLNHHKDVIAGKKKFDYEYKIIRQDDGRETWIQGYGDFEFDQAQRPYRVIGTVQDITKRKRAEEEIIFLSYRDNLTGLYNRRFCEEEIIRLDRMENLPLSVIVGDVNGLKLINDAFGHDKGDELLRKASAAIRIACRERDIAARWGGDEFVVLMPGTDDQEAAMVAERIRENFTNTYVNMLSVSISLGWESKRSVDEDVLRVLRTAEDTMYKQKIIENAGKKGNVINTIINTLHVKNPREEQHSRRVSEICGQIGAAMGFSEPELRRLKVIGHLHDIGKIAVEEQILNKPGQLSEGEWAEMKRHPEIGYRIISSSNDLYDIAEAIQSHHERWDGRGYPKGLAGEEIPLIARIVAIADSYDAMTSVRPYRPALADDFVLGEFQRNAGIQFDPDIVRIFLEKVLDQPAQELG